jgi:hypothetical protein
MRDNSASGRMAHEWDAEHCLRFADARTLPAVDLLSRIALEAPPKPASGSSPDSPDLGKVGYPIRIVQGHGRKFVR